MTSRTSKDLTYGERDELLERARVLHLRYDLGGAYLLGDYVVDYGQGAVAVYRDGVTVYSSSMIFEDGSGVARDILNALRVATVLDDLADA